MDGRKDGWYSRVKDFLQQSKTHKETNKEREKKSWRNNRRERERVKR